MTRTGPTDVPARHRHGLREPRCGLARAGICRATGARSCATSRRVAGVLRAVGAASPRHPRAAHARRRLERRLPVPHRARDHRRERAGARVARDLCRRARLGALRADRVRPCAVGDALGGGPAARHGRRRLPRDRRAPAREGLSRLVERHHPRREPVRGGARVRRRPRQGDRVPRARCARRGEGRRPAQAAALPRARRPAGRLPRQRARACRWRDRGARDLRWLRVRGRALHRLRVPAAEMPRSGRRGEVEVFGDWIGFEVAREPLWDPSGERIRA